MSCRDRHGIVAAVSSFLTESGANITSSDQHSTDPEGGTFFMRMEFRLEGLQDRRHQLEQSFAESVAKPFEMDWRVAYLSDRKRLALLASRDEHCLLDLLWRWRRGELPGTVVAVISNHEDHIEDVASFGVPYHYVPITRSSRDGAEEQMLGLLSGEADVVVLARYMQILSAEFLERLEAPVINIHHSFLPAFVGSNPYRQAFERGVKIIGATAHFVTEALDEGPIIAQSVVPVDHSWRPEEMAQAGRDVEKIVLAKALKLVFEERVFLSGNRTIVFD